MAFYRCAGGTDPTGNAGVGDVLSEKTFSNADGIDKTGNMTNNGAVSVSLNTSTTSYTVPAGYHNGSGKVSITTQEKSVTSSRSAQTVTPDSGKVLSKVTVNALAPTGTYTPTSRAANIDMGSTSNYRYVTTTSVPNSNSGTYTYAANSTGGTVDMGATNTYRYVNAANVYAKGKADGMGSNYYILNPAGGSYKTYTVSCTGLLMAKINSNSSAFTTGVAKVDYKYSEAGVICKNTSNNTYTYTPTSGNMTISNVSSTGFKVTTSGGAHNYIQICICCSGTPTVS